MIKTGNEDRIRQMRQDGPDVVAESQFNNELLRSLSTDPTFSALKALDVAFVPGECVNLSPINSFSGLEELVMIGVSQAVGAIKVSDLGHLKKIELYNWSELKDLSFLVGSDSPVRELALQQCPLLHSLEGVQHLEHIRRLSIFRCEKLQDIRALAQLEGLEELKLLQVPSLTDITPIFAMKSLRGIGLPRNGSFGDAAISELKRHLPNCRVELS